MNLPDYTPRLGTFKPVRTDNLREGVDTHIGKQFYFSHAWFIEEEDGGPYVGQVAHTVKIGEDYFSGNPEPYIGWVPTEDIEFAPYAQQ